VKKIVFKFIGGPKDGETLIGRFGEGDEAEKYFVLSNHGRVGQRFRIASEYAVETLASEKLQEDAPHHFRPHVYRVTDCLEDQYKVFIRAEYVREGP
jgi:hypothetical protein